MKRQVVNGISSVTCQELDQIPINLVKNQDYEVISDVSTFSLIITKKLASEKKHFITIKVLDKENIEKYWEVISLPKG